jgi:hypothetical protein
MEQQLAAPPEEGEEPKSATEVVADVLDDSTKKNMFLQNVGIKTGRPRSNVQNVQAQLEVEKKANSFMQNWMIWKGERRKKNKQG